MTPNPAERGVAVPLALFVLVVLSVMIGATLWAAHLESRAGRQALEAIKARVAADLAWPDILNRADSLGISSLISGDSLTLGPWAGAGAVAAGVVVHRLGREYFLVESVGMAGRLTAHPGASYRVEVLARLDSTLDSLTGQPTRRLTPLAAPYWSSLPRAH